MLANLPFSSNTPWLAPLAGYSDLPFRLLCREYGACCCTTEMISAKGLYYKSPGTKRLLATNDKDTPLIAQIFGAEEEYLRFAVQKLRTYGFQYFDLNIGCSVPKVMRQHAGAGMLFDPENILRCVAAMIDEAGLGFVGCKLRLGIESTNNLMPDLALKLQDLGVAWITLHPRFAKQGFQGKADWEQLRLLAKTLSIPLVGSGDLLSGEDGVRCISETHVSTVMYARGALAKPAIFIDHTRLLANLPPKLFSQNDVKKLMLRHLELAQEYANGTNPVARMRGILAGYVRNLPNAKNIRVEICQAKTWEDFPKILAHWM